MKKVTRIKPPSRRLFLEGETALDLMIPDAPSLPASMPVEEAARFLIARGTSAAAVVDDGGRPVGVLSRADIVRHESRQAEETPPLPRRATSNGRDSDGRTRVADIMTPVVLSLRSKTPANTVVGALLSLEVHQLFVTDEGGAIIGVVSTKDILRHLQPEAARPD